MTVEHKSYGKSFAQCLDCDCTNPPCQEAQNYAKELEIVHRKMLDNAFGQTKDMMGSQAIKEFREALGASVARRFRKRLRLED
jgi:hypothetical protein